MTDKVSPEQLFVRREFLRLAMFGYMCFLECAIVEDQSITPEMEDLYNRLVDWMDDMTPEEEDAFIDEVEALAKEGLGVA